MGLQTQQDFTANRKYILGVVLEPVGGLASGEVPHSLRVLSQEAGPIQAKCSILINGR